MTITAIVLSFIFFCGGLTIGGSLGAADYKHKIENSTYQVHNEAETKTVVVDETEK